MANIPLKTITFPGLDDTYTVPQLDDTLAVEGDAAESSAVGAALETKADKDGTYPDLTAGLADMATQLKSTVGITDKEPYLFRTSGGSSDIGDFETDKIVGGSVAWNQLVKIPASSKSKTENGVTWVDNRDGTITVSTESGGATAMSYIAVNDDINLLVGHKYLIKGCPSGGSLNTYGAYLAGTTGAPSDVGAGTIGIVLASTQTGTFVIRVEAETIISNALTFRPQVFDLTQMFGSTIADYIYSLEQATEGAGVAWFRKLFPKPYYQHNPGTLIHVGNISKHKMVGFNQWDEEWELGYIYNGNNTSANDRIRSKNYISVVPNTVYNFHHDGTATMNLFYYDASKNYISTEDVGKDQRKTTPDNCYYIRFYMGSAYGTTYKNDICINLSWDGERDGEYAPYVAYEYPLDADFYLLGVPKLDANNRLYFDGDEYASDGTVKQRFFTYTVTGNETFNVNDQYIKQNSCDAYILIANLSDLYDRAKTINGARCNKLLVPTTQSSLWAADAPNEFALNSKQLHLNIANTLLGITDYTQETTSSVRNKIKAFCKELYDNGEPLIFVLPAANLMYAQSDPYENPQRVDDFGTEEYVAEPFGTNDVILPVGHSTFYQANLRAKLEMAPNSPSDGDGDYIVRQTDGENTYVPLVIPPAVQVVNETIDFDPSVSVEAGAIISTDFALNVPTGYTPAMVVVVGTNNLNAFATMEQNFSISPAKLLVTLKNITDSARTLSYVEANVLCVKSE